MLMPAAGFASAPTDCLGALVAAKLPGADRLRIGISRSGPAGPSRGTLRGIFDHSLAAPTVVRRDGEIEVSGYLRHDFDYGRGPSASLAVGLADVATGFYSTGIPNVAAYYEAGWPLRGAYRALRRLLPLLTFGPIRRFANRRIDRLPEGPTDREQRESSTVIVAEVENNDGDVVSARLRLPEVYLFTAQIAVEIAARITQGGATPGFQTPSRAFGADFVLGFEGVTEE